VTFKINKFYVLPVTLTHRLR